MESINRIKYEERAIITYPIYLNLGKSFAQIDSLYEAIKLKSKDKNPVLVCQGSSGLFIATALCQKDASFQMIYLRKDNEDSHSYSSSHSSLDVDLIDNDNNVIIFVDDFVSTGKTLYDVMIRLRLDYRLYIEIVAVLKHCEFVTELKNNIMANFSKELPRIILHSR